MYPRPRIRISILGRLAFPHLVWKVEDRPQTVFLTFDDGPVPGVTEWVLDMLRDRGLKATFFCVGDNVRKYPHIYQRIISEGHAVGNHTYNHLNGWKTAKEDYIANVDKASGYIHSNLLRPPYGKILPRAARILSRKYKIVMWDVLSRDYNPALSGHDCARIVATKATAGSIIVFHDSLKAERNIRVALPIVIDDLQRKGFSFDKISF